MICEHCGAQNDDNSYFCGQCGARLRPADIYKEDIGDGDLPQTETASTENNDIRDGDDKQNGGYNINPQAFDEEYSNEYDETYEYTTDDLNLIKEESIIVPLIIGICVGSVSTIVLSALALLRRRDFETAIKDGDHALADQKLKIALKLKKWAWVLCVITFIVSLASVVLDEIDPILSEHLEKIMITAFGLIN